MEASELRLSQGVQKYFYDNPAIKTVAATIFAFKLVELEKKYEYEEDPLTRANLIADELDSQYAVLINLAATSHNLAEHVELPGTRRELIADYLEHKETV